MTKAELVNIVNNICSSLKLDENYTVSQKCSMLIGTNVDLDKAEANNRIDYIYGLVMESKFARLYNPTSTSIINKEHEIIKEELLDDEDSENSEATVEELLDDEE